MADVKTASALPPQPTAPGGPRVAACVAADDHHVIVVVLVIVAIIAGVKFTQISALIAQSKQPLPAAVVTAPKVPFDDWQPTVSAIGSIKAVRGVDVTTEVGGIAQGDWLCPGPGSGRAGAAGALNADSDIALLHSLEATADLAAIVLKRTARNWRSTPCPRHKWTATAPTSKPSWPLQSSSAHWWRKNHSRPSLPGVSGLPPPRAIPNPGDKNRHAADLRPLIYIDFNVPQTHSWRRLPSGKSFLVSADGLSNQTFTGRVSTIDTRFDPDHAQRYGRSQCCQPRQTGARHVCACGCRFGGGAALPDCATDCGHL